MEKKDDNEVKDIKFGDILHKEPIRDIGKKIENKGKDVIKNLSAKIANEEHMMENKDYYGSMVDAKEIANGSRALILAATIIGPFAGPMAVMFSVDMDPTQFAIMLAVLIANAIASIITAFINDLNIRGTAKSVAKSVFYRFSSKGAVSELEITNYKKEIENVTTSKDREISELTKERDELKKLITDYDKLRFKVAVEDGIKKSKTEAEE